MVDVTTCPDLLIRCTRLADFNPHIPHTVVVYIAAAAGAVAIQLTYHASLPSLLSLLCVSTPHSSICRQPVATCQLQYPMTRMTFIMMRLRVHGVISRAFMMSPTLAHHKPPPAKPPPM